MLEGPRLASLKPGYRAIGTAFGRGAGSEKPWCRGWKPTKIRKGGVPALSLKMAHHHTDKWGVPRLRAIRFQC